MPQSELEQANREGSGLAMGEAGAVLLDRAITSLLGLLPVVSAKPTVLVVEDTATDAKVAVETLRQCGFEVIVAGSSEDAEAQLKMLEPVLIVLDIVLLGESGYEFCRRLKADPLTQAVPVIMCSTKSSKIDQYWGLKQGAAAYLTKPVDSFLLRRTAKMLAP